MFWPALSFLQSSGTAQRSQPGEAQSLFDPEIAALALLTSCFGVPVPFAGYERRACIHFIPPFWTIALLLSISISI